MPLQLDAVLRRIVACAPEVLTLDLRDPATAFDPETIAEARNILLKDPAAAFQPEAIAEAQDILDRINAIAAGLEDGDAHLQAVLMLLGPAATYAAHLLLVRINSRCNEDGSRPACPLPPFFDVEFIGDVEFFITSDETRLCTP